MGFAEHVSYNLGPSGFDFFFFFNLHFSSPVSSVGVNGSTGLRCGAVPPERGLTQCVGVCYGDRGLNMISGLWMKVIVQQEPQNRELYITVPI